MLSQQATSIIICVGRILLSIEQIINVCGPGGLKGPQDEGLPEAFPGVLEQLPITQRVLDALKRRLNKRNCDRDSIEEQESYPSILQLVGDCNTRATKMESIYQAVVPGDPKGRELRYRQSTSVDETVEVLMKEMLVSMLQVSDSPLLLIGESERKDLEAALEAVKRLASSLTEEEKSGYVYNITNSGSGLQPVHSGRGHQHIYGHNLGGAFHGPTHLYSAGHQQPSGPSEAD